ncbi:MAG: hypothetical protein EOP04_30500 [Proteobacteria bacterium]|nr:MAG: hypothetical protein EOP04_30500 [Pseudomonadota bacterium]
MQNLSITLTPSELFNVCEIWNELKYGSPEASKRLASLPEYVRVAIAKALVVAVAAKELDFRN